MSRKARLQYPSWLPKHELSPVRTPTPLHCQWQRQLQLVMYVQEYEHIKLFCFNSPIAHELSTHTQTKLQGGDNTDGVKNAVELRATLSLWRHPCR